MADMNDLLAQLQKTRSPGHEPVSQSQTEVPRSVSVVSPELSSPVATASLRDSTNMASNPSQPSRDGPDRTTNLLNLLKFNQPSASPSPAQQNLESRKSGPSRAISTSELMTSLGVNPTSNPSAETSASANLTSNAPAVNPTSPSNEKSQELLLNLLNRTQGPQKETTSRGVSMEKLLSRENATAETEAPRIRESTPLAASSPRNSTPQPTASARPTSKIEILKPERDTVPTQLPATVAKAPTPSPLPDGRSKLEAIMGIGSQADGTATVSEAVNQVGEQADRQIREALAKVETKESGTPKNEDSKIGAEDIHEAMHKAAKELKKELKDPEGKAAIEANMPKPMAEAFEDTIDVFAKEAVADHWEQAEDGNGTDSAVKVFNLPMWPFKAIDIQPSSSTATPLRMDIVTKIATLKKEFDQVDRNLAAASVHHIVYAMAKGGGFRVVRQDDGSNAQVFRKAENEMFNVSVHGPAPGSGPKDIETILATGVNGSVYWTTVTIPAADSEEPLEGNLESHGFIFPPQQSQDENNTSGAQLKTRAKQSSRHPEFFAVGRGKSIHIIHPELAKSSAYIDANTRVVNSEKYLSDSSLKIYTGKAGKDFSFSADDTTIVSLDKAGKLKFWDIRAHVDPSEAPRPGRYRVVETKTPMMTLVTATQNDKSWATSVQFVDKERPMAKGGALRYLLVGLKQNHTLQLWDLGLKKAVQELNFPHGKETDPICSIVYHPKSAIISVGHPTRNSIYLIHLSAPRYGLPNMTQAKFIERLAAKDDTLPRPDSTAIMSGIREISLSSLGELRSLDVVDQTNSNIERPDQEDETIFEVYMMHSRGVDCLNIKREDLGWGADGKVSNALDAMKENVVTVRDLPVALAIKEGSESNQVENKDIVTSTSSTVINAVPKASVIPTSEGPVPSKAKSEGDNLPPALTNGENEKKPANKAEGPASATQKTESYASAAQRAPAPESDKPDQSAREASVGGKSISFAAEPMPNISVKVPPPQIPEAAVGPDFAKELTENMATAMGNTLTSVFERVLGDQFGNLYKQLDDDKRVQEAAGAAKQDAILRLVSSTLTDNVEKNLARIVTSSIKDNVVPALQSHTVQVIDRKLNESVANNIRITLPQELNATLGPALDRSLQNPEILRLISDLISNKVAEDVGNTLLANLQQSLAPNFKQMTSNIAQSMVEEVERRMAEQLRQADMQRQHASAKIDQLTNLTHELFDTIRSMAGVQSALQDEVLKMQSQLAQPRGISTESGVSQAATAQPVPAIAPDLAEIMDLMSNAHHEEGSIKWIQSGRSVELFDEFFVRYDPNYLAEVNVIVVLSVAACVTASFQNNLAERIHWVETAFANLEKEIQSPEVTEVAPKVLDVIRKRLQELYMSIFEREPEHPILERIFALVRAANTLKANSVGS